MWHHVLQGFNFEQAGKGIYNSKDIGYKYSVTRYPTQILVDSTCIVLARIEGDAIDDLTDMLDK